MIADMSVAPEIARLAEAVLLLPPQSPAEPHGPQNPHGPQAPSGPQAPRGPQNPHGPQAPGSAGHEDAAATATATATATAAAPLTLGTLARRLRSIAAAPERWWGLVRFDQDRSVTIMVEQSTSYQAWLVILPPGDAGQSCDCEVATMIAGEATEGMPSSAILRPGPLRVHGQRHGLRGRGPGFSISLHARAHRPAVKTY